jgi:hypothetical protein
MKTSKEIFATQREANLVGRREKCEYDSHYLRWEFLHIEELRRMLSKNSLEQKAEFCPCVWESHLGCFEVVAR